MAIWSVADITKELHDVVSLLKVRNPAGSSDDPGYIAMATAMVNGICCKIKGMKGLSAGSAIEIYAAISSLSLDDQFKQKLTSTIDDVVSGESLQSAAILVNTPQSLLSPHHYLTQKEWDTLSSQSCSYWDGLHVVANRLRAIGIKSIKEDTKKACAALLIHVHMDKGLPMPAYKHIYQMSQDLSQAHSSSTQQQPIGLSSLSTYPDVPPPELVKLAYHPDEPPVIKALPKLLHLIANHTPVRNTSSLLRDEPAVKKSDDSSSSSSIAMIDCMKNMMLCMQQIASQGQKPALNTHIQMCTPSSNQPSMLVPPVSTTPLAIQDIGQQSTMPTHHPVTITSSAASTFKPKMRLPLIDHIAKVAASKKDSDHKQADESTSSKPHMTLEDYERMAFDQLTKRTKKTKDKPAQPKKASSKPTAGNVSSLKLGCPRCRGSINGCSTCRVPTYNGIRLHGKTEWEKHMKMSKKARLTK
jgi:hypothetical protein